ncbi:MAG: hypothetical protein QW802_04830 [Candidatus Altiarchaeota archaeon]
MKPKILITDRLTKLEQGEKLLEGCFPSGKKERLMEEFKNLKSQSKLGSWVK